VFLHSLIPFLPQLSITFDCRVSQFSAATANSGTRLNSNPIQGYFTTDSLTPISSFWRQAPWDSQPVSSFPNWTLAVIVLIEHPLWQEVRLSYTIAAGLRQRSHSQVRVPQDSWPHFTVSDSKLPQPGGPGPRIYMSQEQSGLVIFPGSAFPFRGLLRLAGLWWRYLTPP
jgi:hypothetical protein